MLVYTHFSFIYTGKQHFYSEYTLKTGVDVWSVFYSWIKHSEASMYLNSHVIQYEFETIWIRNVRYYTHWNSQKQQYTHALWLKITEFYIHRRISVYYAVCFLFLLWFSEFCFFSIFQPFSQNVDFIHLGTRSTIHHETRFWSTSTLPSRP